MRIASMDRMTSSWFKAKCALRRQYISPYTVSFVQHAATHVETLRIAATGDVTALERTARILKSSSTHTGALGMAELCQKLQDLGLTGTVAGAAELVEQLKGEFDRVRHTLAQECSKQTTDGDPSPRRVCFK